MHLKVADIGSNYITIVCSDFNGEKCLSYNTKFV